MALLKVLFLLAAALSNHVAFTTSSSPPPSEDGNAKHVTHIDRISLSMVRRLFEMNKFIGWCAAACEIILIIAAEYPSTTFGKFVSTHPETMTTSSGKLAINQVFLIGFALSILGVCIRMECLHVYCRHFMSEVTIRTNGKHRLCKNGPYAVVRHPSYVGLCMNITGLVFWLGSAGSLVMESKLFESAVGRTLACLFPAGQMLAVGVLLRKALKEEELFSADFPEEWEEWAKRIPDRFIPGLI
ncbi:uncharacterized protein LAESUDRAFT_732525 [Laetiporus sulphureus 93-53]|uniref:Protein-S-isoprenylcysteine O-methyltransferase n=1 Tax=Laetiporus sulphureus 93-53 TaxID=1314785 RepID=A0A165B483_9APHY|nr:uncharacterized protein LAESUDRAFT_732525 [Laetiporus sulphureus 93-53]KZT00194.1 hypothetical protein LAESUDRAFT_732525 [Laetiporus sulphureus 93-53]